MYTVELNTETLEAIERLREKLRESDENIVTPVRDGWAVWFCDDRQEDKEQK